MAGMPVATLRIWEQRYQVVHPVTAPSGHRLYSAADVERVTLLRRLTQLGHAIGMLAPLDVEQMRALLGSPIAAHAPAGAEAPSPHATMQIVVAGQAMAYRLKRLAARQFREDAPQWVGFFDSLADAEQAAKGSTGVSVDLLLWQAVGLHAGALPALQAAREAWGARRVAVVYQYSSAAALAELTGAGLVVTREPEDEASLSQWLASLDSRAVPSNAVSAPRFAEADLMAFAELSSAIACECPSHLAELILRLSSFETYSGGCANRNAADAELHTYLQRVAGAARMMFETAIERVAFAEGLALPPAHPADTNVQQPGLSA